MRRGVLILLAGLPVLGSASTADARAPATAAAKAVSGQLIVGFEKRVSADRQRAVLKKLGDHVTPNPALGGKSVTGGQLDVAGALSGAG